MKGSIPYSFFNNIRPRATQRLDLASIRSQPWLLPVFIKRSYASILKASRIVRRIYGPCMHISRKIRELVNSAIEETFPGNLAVALKLLTIEEVPQFSSNLHTRQWNKHFLPFTKTFHASK